MVSYLVASTASVCYTINVGNLEGSSKNKQMIDTMAALKTRGISNPLLVLRCKALIYFPIDVMNFGSIYTSEESDSHHQSFLYTQGMKTIIILGVLLLASLSQALPFKDNIDSDEEYIPATDIESFHLLPFLRAVMTSDEIQREVMRNWLINKGILKRKQPKKKLQYIRLF